jgi:hypothetical protein
MIDLKTVRAPAGCAPRGEWWRRVVESVVGRRTIWERRDGRFCVVLVELKYGGIEPGQHYAPQWRAYRMLWRNGTYPVYEALPGSPFRKPRPAFAAVRRAVEAEDHESAKARK